MMHIGNMEVDLSYDPEQHVKRVVCIHSFVSEDVKCSTHVEDRIDRPLSHFCRGDGQIEKASRGERKGGGGGGVGHVLIQAVGSDIHAR